MMCFLSIIMCIIFLGNVSGEVQHVSIGTIDPSYRYKDLVLTIVSPENRIYPILKIENVSDGDIEMDIKSCSITLKTKEKDISGSKLSFPKEIGYRFSASLERLKCIFYKRIS